MSKHRYHANELEQVDWELLARQCADQARVVFAIDVAKDDFVGGLMAGDRTLVELVKWTHPQQTRVLVERLVAAFGVPRLEVVMEPSGTYGDALRGLLVAAGVRVFRLSPKRVHDVAELYDGVPSLHDAKAAYLIGRLHLEGVSQPWQEPSAQRRTLSAQLGLLELYQERWQRSRNRLEALLSRHWPEALRVMDLGSITLLTVLATYGDAAQVAAHAEDAAVLMQRTGRAGLERETIEQLLDSARHTLGRSCLEAERQVLRVVAQDLLSTHQALRRVERSLEGEVQADSTLERMGAVVGKTTAAVLCSSLGSAQSYPDAASYLKSAGLNLKERSSGSYPRAAQDHQAGTFSGPALPLLGGAALDRPGRADPGLVSTQSRARRGAQRQSHHRHRAQAHAGALACGPWRGFRPRQALPPRGGGDGRLSLRLALTTPDHSGDERHGHVAHRHTATRNVLLRGDLRPDLWSMLQDPFVVTRHPAG